MTTRRFVAAGRLQPRPRRYECRLCDAAITDATAVEHVYTRHPEFWREHYGDRKPATT